MNIFKKLTSFAAAMALILSVSGAAFADEEEYPYTEDSAFLTEDGSAPTLSFDTDVWMDYVKVTPLGKELGGISLGNEKNNAYQASTMKVSVKTTKAVTELQQFAWDIKDANGNYMYPEARDDETADASERANEYATLGIELNASDFGLSYFDGATIYFYYRFNPNSYDILMGDSIFAYGAQGDDYLAVGTAKRLKFNDSDENNVTTYRSTSVPVKRGVGADKFVITVPVQLANMDMPVVYIDNITIQTQSGLFVKNVDNYNVSAVPQEVQNDVQVVPHEKRTADAVQGKENKDSKAKNIIAYIGIGAIAVVILVVVVIVIKKKSKKFY